MSIDRAHLAIGALAIVAAALSWPAWRHLREVPPAPPPAVRGTWTPPAGLTPDADPERPFGLAITPGGRTAVVAGALAGRRALWLVDMAGGQPREIPGTDDAVEPAVSPDGARVAYFARGRLRSIGIDGSGPRDLAEAPSPRGAAWLPDGALAFTPAAASGIVRVPGEGGPAAPLTRVDTAQGDTSHRHAQLAGAGTHLLYIVRSSTPGREGLWLGRLDGTPVGRISGTTTAARATASHVLLLSDGALLAQRLDLERGSLEGRPDVLATGVGRGPLDQLLVAMGGHVLLAGPPPDDRRALQWVGGPAGGAAPAAPGVYWDLRVAPDGRRVAVTMPEPQLGTLDVFVLDADGARPRRISLSIDGDDQPVWGPQGDRLAYVQGGQAIVTRGAQAQLPDETVYRARTRLRLDDWSPDGRTLVFSTASPDTGEDIWTVPVTGGDATRVVATAAAETDGVVSPDGQWLAYVSDASGRAEVVVGRLGSPAGARPITTGGGADPRWRRDGRALFFRRGAQVFVTDVVAGPDGVTAGEARPVTEVLPGLRAWDVTPDGTRVLVNVPAPRGDIRPATLLVHWQSLLSPPPQRRRNPY